jgi:predicted lipid-binding transport protein (Tim44 family)
MGAAVSVHPDPRRRVAAAQLRLENARRRFRHDTAPLRAEFARHRAAWLLAGGFAGGIAVGMLPRRLWSGLGAMLGSIGAIAVRSLLAPVVAGAVVARDRGGPANRPPAA